MELRTIVKSVRVSLLMLSVAAMTLGGCGKKRSKEFVQGDGEHINAISEFDGKTFTMTTGEKLFKGETSRADTLEVLDGFKDVNSLDSVAFDIPSSLLEGLDLSDFHFYGKENHTYEVQYKLTDNMIILSKVAPQEDIPSQEMTYAESLGNGRYAVPMLGLPVSYATVEEVKDAKGKDTRRIATFGKKFKNEATHFKADQNAITYFKTEPKLDLLKADFFNSTDEWYYTKTLIGRPINSEETLGEQLAALRMKFVRTNNSILGVDLNIAPEQTVLDPEKTVIALEIPVEWADFKLTTTGAAAFLEETKITNGTPGARFWANRAYGLLDFNNADRLQMSQTQENKLEKLEISENYISFTIYQSSTGFTYQYSMVKAKKPVEGQVLYGDDKENFHFFADLRKVINGSLNTQVSDIEKLVHTQRIYPDNGEIVFHISKNTPEIPAYIQSIKDAVQAWDDAFAKADVGIRVRLADKRVELGDVRYHKIIFYGYEIDAGNLLGVGPSVGDSRTGEVFSASTHIFLRTYREGLIRNIRSYLRDQLGLYKDKRITGIEAFDKAEGEVIRAGALVMAGNSVKTADFDGYMATKYPQYVTQKVKSPVDVVTSSKIPVVDQFDAKTLYDLVSPAKSCSFASIAASANSFKRLEERCLGGKTALSDYVDRLKAANQSSDEVVYNVDGEHDAILACANVMMQEQLFSTLVHEMGHNFGLGHNFAASSDAKNFPRNDKGEVVSPYSSVMDYPDDDFDNFHQVGPYDVAAIRYLYGRKAETEDGEIIAIPREKSIKTTMAELGKKPRAFRVCNDVEAGLNGTDMFLDPMCARWDVGANPVEVTRWAIAQIHAGHILNGYLYNNRTMWSASGSTYFDRLRRIYEQWRYLIENRVNGRYLTAFATGDDYHAAMKKIVDEEAARGNTTYRDYYEASRMIYEFARDIVFQPIRFCVLQGEGRQPTPIEFIRLRSKIFETKNETVQTCEQAKPHLPDLMALGFMGGPEVLPQQFELNQAGSNLQPLELTLDPNEMASRIKRSGFEDWDGVNFGLNPIYAQGIMNLKNGAMGLLFDRAPRLVTGARRNFLPAMVDEPGNRQEIANLVRDRILKGESWSRLGFKDLNGFIPAFAESRNLNNILVFNMLKLTDGPESTGQFRAQFSTTRYNNFDINSGTSDIIDIISRGDSYWYNLGVLSVGRRGTYAHEILTKLNRLEQAYRVGAYRAANRPLEGELVTANNDGEFQLALQAQIDGLKGEGSDELTTEQQVSASLAALVQSMVTFSLYPQNDQVVAFARLLQTDLAAAAAGGASVDLMAVASGAVKKFFQGNLGNTIRFEMAFSQADPENFDAQSQFLRAGAVGSWDDMLGIDTGNNTFANRPREE